MTRAEKRAIINRKDFLPDSCEIDAGVLQELHRHAVSTGAEDIVGTETTLATIKKIRKDIIASKEA